MFVVGSNVRVACDVNASVVGTVDDVSQPAVGLGVKGLAYIVCRDSLESDTEDLKLLACGDLLNGQTKLIHVPKKNKLKRGDLMITAGNSGLFPKDYPIGTILEIGFDSNGLSVCADIQPCVDVNRLTSVIVITDFSGKKEDEENED